jgi:hypothetical protein
MWLTSNPFTTLRIFFLLPTLCTSRGMVLFFQTVGVVGECLPQNGKLLSLHRGEEGEKEGGAQRGVHVRNPVDCCDSSTFLMHVQVCAASSTVCNIVANADSRGKV